MVRLELFLVSTLDTIYTMDSAGRGRAGVGCKRGHIGGGRVIGGVWGGLDPTGRLFTTLPLR